MFTFAAVAAFASSSGRLLLSGARKELTQVLDARLGPVAIGGRHVVAAMRFRPARSGLHGPKLAP